MLLRALGHLPAVLFAFALALAAPAPAQELTPGEERAFAALALGDGRGATRALLEQAAAAARTPGDAAHAARIEAWATVAVRVSRFAPTGAVLDAIDALRRAPAAAADPLLADRLAVLGLDVAETLPARADGNGAARARALGCLDTPWLIGPFANERGSGLTTVLPPEQGLDLDAEVPGKVRPVRWRQLPARPCTPALPLDRVLQPREQVLVYLAAAVLAEHASEVVLELGSTGSWAVFTNGAKVASRDVEREFEYDQDPIALPLRAGPNLLLLKVCHQEGDAFTVAARLRARNGEQPTAVRFSTERADLLAAATAASTTRPAAEVPAPDAAPIPLGGRSTWPIGEAKGADALRLAWLWRARDADGDRDRRDAKAAQAAIEALPDRAEPWLLASSTRIPHGRSAADRDDNERRRALEQALAKSPGHVEASAYLGMLLRESSNLWRPARELAAAALQRAPHALLPVLLHARTLRDEGLSDRADAELLAHAAASEHPELWRTAASLLSELEPARALAFRERVLEVSATEADAVAAASQLARVRRDADAKAVLERTMVHDPFARRAHRQLAELALAHGDARAAITTLERWLRHAPDDADTMVLAARAWRALADTEPQARERQLELLRACLQVEPNRRDEERYAAFLARQLEAAGAGAGGTADAAAAFHVPWRVDAAALVAADPGPPADAAEHNDPLHWLLRQQIVRANANGTTNVYQHDVVRVLTTDGARALQQWQLPHYRGEQRARLLGCTVFRADGSVQRPALQGARVRLPDLRPGDVVAVEGRIDDTAPTFFGDYFGLVHTFGSPDRSPVRTQDLLVLCAPGRDYRCQAAQGAPEPERTTLPDGTLALRCVLRDLERDQPELQRPRRRELQPTLRITTYRDWDQFAAWWWNLIKNQLEVTPEMRRTVQERTAGLATLDAKIAALYHFVTTDVRYEAWEFGVHGYKPYATSVIHERRHGDCKDKALLLCALLGEIGVACRPVLIFADPQRSRDDLTLPMVEQFNHCIAWLPPQHGRPGRFLDGTATWHPTDTLPDMDQGADVLVVDAGKAELRTVPWTTPAANVERQEQTLELAADGSARLQRDDRPLGNRAVDLRMTLATEPVRLREVIARTLVQTFGKATLTDLVPGLPADPEQPVTLRTIATLPELGQRTATTWQLPSTWAENELLALTADPERKTPLLLGVPTGQRHTLRYTLPPPWRAGELPADVAHETPFARFAMRWRGHGDVVVVERELDLTAPRIEPAQYGAFRDFVAAVKTADSQLVLLRKEERR